ncbi:MAG TPA: phospholipid carrier-dependent glycosyltransferase [Chthoniobacterales bacterium]|nr:phospholipid carrier-dependent glycosyltransferase [Chthoniobacterales bacterium]
MSASSESHLNFWRRTEIVALIITLLVGIFLRLPAHDFEPGAALSSIAALHPQAAFKEKGFDEGLYAEYTNKLDQFGLSSYPLIVKDYVERQERLGRSILSPLRFLYIFSGYAWHRAFGSENLHALKSVASLFSILTLCLSAIFAWRCMGRIWALGISALMAVAPTQLHMSQHALVDGFFTFWAMLVLWLFWENLHAPKNWRWLLAYIVALALLVVTKENSFFVWVALVALLIANYWLQFGTVSREIILATIIGPLLGTVMLILLAGGVPELIHTYRYSMVKNLELPYAISTGDGPWFRYLVDLMLVSPIVLILAIGTAFRLDRVMKMEWFMTIFIAASYLVMCNVKYGMNLRYANMWDLPLRFLALSEIVWLASFAKQFRRAITVTAVALLVVIEFHQYIVLAVRYPLYELITHDLLEALKILKPM